MSEALEKAIALTKMLPHDLNQRDDWIADELIPAIDVAAHEQLSEAGAVDTKGWLELFAALGTLEIPVAFTVLIELKARDGVAFETALGSLDEADRERIGALLEASDETAPLPVLESGPTAEMMAAADAQDPLCNFVGGPLGTGHAIEGKLTILIGGGIKIVKARTGGRVRSYKTQYGPTPPGVYAISHYRPDRTGAYARGNIGFSFNLDPVDGTAVFGRSEFRIHPDGPPAGTHGCIGIVEDDSKLSEIRDEILQLLDQQRQAGRPLKIFVRYQDTAPGVATFGPDTSAAGAAIAKAEITPSQPELDPAKAETTPLQPDPDLAKPEALPLQLRPAPADRAAAGGITGALISAAVRGDRAFAAEAKRRKAEYKTWATDTMRFFYARAAKAPTENNGEEEASVLLYTLERMAARDLLDDFIVAKATFAFDCLDNKRILLAADARLRLQNELNMKSGPFSRTLGHLFGASSVALVLGATLMSALAWIISGFIVYKFLSQFASLASIFILPNTTVATVTSAALFGSLVSIVTRLREFSALRGLDPWAMFLNALFKPLIGVALSIVLVVILAGKFVTIGILPGDQLLARLSGPPLFVLWLLGFLSGFSERFVLDFIDRAQGVAGSATTAQKPPA